jgi:hypothetical protein
MNRRGFMKSLLTTPLLTPMLLASQQNLNQSELYIISGDPDRFLTSILDELHKITPVNGKSFAFSNRHPQEFELSRALRSRGWNNAASPARADLVLSCSILQNQARPSFSLIQNGRIWDIRTRKLRSIWNEMNRSNVTSNCLTIAGLRPQNSPRNPGDSITVFKNGHRLEKISLRTNGVRTFSGNSGAVTVNIQQGRAWISQSSCPNKICRMTPPIFLPGERILCAPNHFVLEVQGRNAVDTVIG